MIENQLACPQIPNIQLPDLMLHPDTFKASKLISPCKSIQLSLTSDSPQGVRSVPYVMAPDPSELPMPSMLIPKFGDSGDEVEVFSNGTADETAGSGKLENSLFGNLSNANNSSDVLSSSEDNHSTSIKRK